MQVQDSPPDAHCKNLALSLHNLRDYIEYLKLWRKARNDAGEAADLDRQLYRTDPDTYREDFATSLRHLCSVLRMLELDGQLVSLAHEIRMMELHDPNNGNVLHPLSMHG